MEDNLISVAEAAKVFRRHKNSLFKVIKRLNIKTVGIKSEAARGQTSAHISSEDFDILKSHINIKGVLSSPVSQETDGSTGGYFYIIQLEPEFDPKRLKLGFATSVKERIRKHRTAAPFCTLLRSWPCISRWENAAIDCLTEISEKISTEIIRVEDVDQILRTAEAFFEMMPAPFPDSE